MELDADMLIDANALGEIATALGLREPVPERLIWRALTCAQTIIHNQAARLDAVKAALEQ
jgi:hypothetical protein